MPFLEIRTSTSGNIVVIIVGLFLTGILLLVGVANLVYPDVPEDALTVNTMMCQMVCCLSVIPLLFAVAAFRGILHKKKEPKD